MVRSITRNELDNQDPSSRLNKTKRSGPARNICSNLIRFQVCACHGLARFAGCILYRPGKVLMIVYLRKCFGLPVCQSYNELRAF